MDICPLTGHWCVKCGSHLEGLVCYEGPEIRKIKDLKACPQVPFIFRELPGQAPKMPA